MDMGGYKMEVKIAFWGCKPFSKSIPYGRVADFIGYPTNPYNSLKLGYFQLNSDLFLQTNN